MLAARGYVVPVADLERTFEEFRDSWGANPNRDVVSTV